MRNVLALSLTIAALAGGASAQPERADDAPFEIAFARLIAGLLAPEEARDRTIWDRVATAGSRAGVHWHFHAPDNYRDRELAADRYRRVGYVRSVGALHELALCGTRTQATALTLRHSTGFGARGSSPLEAAPVMAALGAAGVQWTPLPNVANLPEGDWRRPWSARWRVTAASGASAELQAVAACSNPRMRSGQRCWTNWTLEWAPGEGRHCAVPGRG